MAKAKVIKALDCTADAREWAEKVLRVRIGEVVDGRERALDLSDIEGVHDMRVASRRLRSALRDFRSLADKSLMKKAGGELKQLADALGCVRDQDVAIAALEVLRDKAGKIDLLVDAEDKMSQIDLLEKIKAAAKLRDTRAGFKRVLAAVPDVDPIHPDDVIR